VGSQFIEDGKHRAIGMTFSAAVSDLNNRKHFRTIQPGGTDLPRAIRSSNVAKLKAADSSRQKDKIPLSWLVHIL